MLLLAIPGPWAHAGWLSFLHDVEVHVRLLVALPVLIAAELPLLLTIFSPEELIMRVIKVVF